MTDSFSLIATIFFFFEIVILLFLWHATLSYFYLYKKKKKPNYPLVANDIFEFFNSPRRFFKVFLTPFFMWKIIFEKHQDKDLNKAVKRVRFLLVLFIGGTILMPILIIITTPNLNFRWG